ncbi:(2Fe-2S) ferredoxin domain-containing protein [Candidatus Woesearchaeota archaeon]|nr:(2Fe-2S) ferredoxin domain-containing protein [Candidatus Woesearchaeota archaeon]
MAAEIVNNNYNSGNRSIESAIERIRLPISQQQKTVFVCNGCCCGHEEKGNPSVNNLLFMRLLNGEKNLKIEQPYCLGPCREANVIKVNVKDNNAGTHPRDRDKNYWFRRINTEQDVKDVAEFVKNPRNLSSNLRDKQMWFR